MSDAIHSITPTISSHYVSLYDYSIIAEKKFQIAIYA